MRNQIRTYPNPYGYVDGIFFSIYSHPTTSLNRWAGLNSSEVGIDLLLRRQCLATLLRHKVEHSKTSHFSELGFNKSCF